MRLFVTAPGLVQPLGPGLDVAGSLLFLATDGRPRGLDPASFGAGGELTLHVSPETGMALRPFARWRAGIVLFTDDFLPGGTRHDFIVTAAFGLSHELSPGWLVAAEAQLVHLSNGQGFGAHNPAYDGAGFAVALHHRLEQASEAKRDAEPGAVGTLRSAAAPRSMLATADSSVGRVSGEWLLSVRARVAGAVANGWSWLVDAEGGQLAGASLTEAGAAIVCRWGRFELAPHFGYRRFVATNTLVVAVQAAWHTKWVSALALGHHERNDVFDDTWRAAVVMRAFPADSLMVTAGAGLRDPERFTIEGLHIRPYVAAEWRAFAAGDWQAGPFLERQVSTIDVVGLRVRWGAPPALRDTQRGLAWRRIR